MCKTVDNPFEVYINSKRRNRQNSHFFPGGIFHHRLSDKVKIKVDKGIRGEKAGGSGEKTEKFLKKGIDFMENLRYNVELYEIVG